MSFLNIYNNFDKAKTDKLLDSQFIYNSGIFLHPKETYLQVSNTNFDVNFAGDYKVEIVNCEETILLDITDKVYIVEAQDYNGIYQIAFEITPINVDFYFDDLFLKFTHLGSERVYYTNSFCLTAETEKTTFRLDYKTYDLNSVFSDYYSSIRVSGYYNSIIPKEDTQIYTEINGNIRKSRTILSVEKVYSIDRLNEHVINELHNAINSDLVYFNGVRFTSSEPVSVDERKGKSNLFSASIKGQFDETDTFEDFYQIAPPLEIIELIPFGKYSLASIPSDGRVTFNRLIAYVSGSVRLYDHNTDALLNTLSITVSGDYFTFALPILPLGKYYILFDEGVIKDNLNQTKGITSKEDYVFEILTPQYNPDNYNNSDYFAI